MPLNNNDQNQSFSACVLALLATFAAAAPAPSVAQTAKEQTRWKPAEAPLLTRFAKDISPDRPRPEYPRPMMVRKDWQSLNGMWQFAFDDEAKGKEAGWMSGKDLPQNILVPFTFEAALSGIGKGKEIHEHVWYRRMFTVPKAWHHKRILLNFGAVDWQATVYVNGTEVGHHTGGYAPFAFDITDALKGDGPQEVVVSVYDPADPKKEGWQPKGKQLGSEGIWYTRTTGIWQSVWIEPVALTHLQSIHLDGDPARRALTVTVTLSGALPAVLHVGIIDQGREVKSQYKITSPTATFHIPYPAGKLWTPETPYLYDVKLDLYQQDHVNDSVTSYVGFRKVGIDNGRLNLNGKPYFYRGVLDQGYWPDGILTPPTDAAIKNDVEMIKKLGFNMARKHVKVEDPRWYYWCDHLGVAVWQDMPSSHNLSSRAAQENFTQEWTEVIDATRDYPCVVHWIPFNENWGNPQEFQDTIVNLTRQLDPTRPITDASGWTQRDLTDVVDVHDYGNDLRRQGVEHPTKPKVVGEFGGIALPVPNHTWTTGWGYQTVKTPEELVLKIQSQTSQLFEAANLSGFVYTQLTDVEQELNGLLTYDRLPKADTKLIAPVFEGSNHLNK